mmetsp:Transcript_16343/g.44354  ORF Transcript_16343/g.44354 Transcript_16343/m.44354 type:complete len:231 (-) Transcript_16343:112-804(-)
MNEHGPSSPVVPSDARSEEHLVGNHASGAREGSRGARQSATASRKPPAVCVGSGSSDRSTHGSSRGQTRPKQQPCVRKPRTQQACARPSWHCNPSNSLGGNRKTHRPADATEQAAEHEATTPSRNPVPRIPQTLDQTRSPRCARHPSPQHSKWLERSPGQMRPAARHRQDHPTSAHHRQGQHQPNQNQRCPPKTTRSHPASANGAAPPRPNPPKESCVARASPTPPKSPQ